MLKFKMADFALKLIAINNNPKTVGEKIVQRVSRTNHQNREKKEANK